MTANQSLTRKFRTRTVDRNWNNLRVQADLNPVLARILASRGVSRLEDLDLRLKDLLPPTGLVGIEQAAARIVHAIRNDELILIAGDFDADGATSSALCITMLRQCGASNVDFVVPDRFHFGYGLSQAFVETLLERRPAVIVTVDNGISSHDGIAFARRHDVDVIVTDHHLPPPKLPVANAIVNPALEESTFASAPAGVGVAFYLMVEIRRQLRELEHFDERGLEEPNVADCLDLVALGTVVDLVPLDRNNRVLVASGLARMRTNRTRPGIRALCESSGVKLGTIDEVDLGFRLGPRINAAGRLQDIKVGIQALLAPDIKEARKFVEQLEKMNTERRDLQRDMTDSALESIDSLSIEDETCVCLFLPHFHEGIVGLVAGRIADSVHRPAIVFANSKGSSDKVLKGSARSIEGVHIRDVLAEIDMLHPKLMLTFGGHAMAAGLTIREGSFDRFSAICKRVVGNRVPAEVFEDVRLTDGDLAGSEVTKDLVESIEQHGPWGQQFERPLFHGTFRIISQFSVGKGRHLKLILSKDDLRIDAIAFRQEPVEAEFVLISYRIEINTYAGRNTLQLIVESLEPLQHH